MKRYLIIGLAFVLTACCPFGCSSWSEDWSDTSEVNADWDTTGSWELEDNHLQSTDGSAISARRDAKCSSRIDGLMDIGTTAPANVQLTVSGQGNEQYLSIHGFTEYNEYAPNGVNFVWGVEYNGADVGGTVAANPTNGSGELPVYMVTYDDGSWEVGISDSITYGDSSASVGKFTDVNIFISGASTVGTVISSCGVLPPD